VKRCAGEDVHLPAESPPRARDSSGPRGPWGSYRPANSTRISPSLSSFISPRTIDPKKAALNTLVSSQDGEDLSAALLSEMAPFRRRGHLRPAGEGRGRPGGAGRRRAALDGEEAAAGVGPVADEGGIDSVLSGLHSPLGTA